MRNIYMKTVELNDDNLTLNDINNTDYYYKKLDGTYAVAGNLRSNLQYTFNSQVFYTNVEPLYRQREAMSIQVATVSKYRSEARKNHKESSTSAAPPLRMTRMRAVILSEAAER